VAPAAVTCGVLVVMIVVPSENLTRSRRAWYP
jgi:hypothetical protein